MRNDMMMVLCCLGVLGGCASAPAPNRTLKSTGETIRAAEATGVGRSPRAAVHLQMARDQAIRARQLYEEGHQERAAYLLLRADADVEVAVALSRLEAAETESQKAANRGQAAPTAPTP